MAHLHECRWSSEGWLCAPHPHSSAVPQNVRNAPQLLQSRHGEQAQRTSCTMACCSCQLSPPIQARQPREKSHPRIAKPASGTGRAQRAQCCMLCCARFAPSVRSTGAGQWEWVGRTWNEKPCTPRVQQLPASPTKSQLPAGVKYTRKGWAVRLIFRSWAKICGAHSGGGWMGG